MSVNSLLLLIITAWAHPEYKFLFFCFFNYDKTSTSFIFSLLIAPQSSGNAAVFIILPWRRMLCTGYTSSRNHITDSQESTSKLELFIQFGVAQRLEYISTEHVQAALIK